MHLFMYSQVLFWLMAATDGHTNSFSVHIKDVKLAMGLKESKGKKYLVLMIFILDVV